MPDPIPGAPAGPLDGGELVAIPRATAERWGRAARRVEAEYQDRPTRSGRPADDTVAARKALTGSGGIAAASSTGTPAAGTVTLCTFQSGNWAAGTETVTAYNPSTGGAVSGSQYVTLLWVGGIWEVNLDPC